jgi:hypothetical protein
MQHLPKLQDLFQHIFENADQNGGGFKRRESVVAWQTSCTAM